MVEFQDDGIRLAAVNARMRREVADDLTPVFLTPLLYLGGSAPDVVRPIRRVMRTPVRGLA